MKAIAGIATVLFIFAIAPIYGEYKGDVRELIKQQRGENDTERKSLSERHKEERDDLKARHKAEREQLKTRHDDLIDNLNQRRQNAERKPRTTK